MQARLHLTRHAVPHTRRWPEVARNLGLKPDPVEAGKFLDVPDGLAAGWAATPVQAITRRMIIEVIDEAVERDAPVGANRLLGILARLFNWLVSRDVLKVAPTAGVKKPSLEQSRNRELSGAEIRADENPRQRATVVVFAMRRAAPPRLHERKIPVRDFVEQIRSYQV